MSLLVLNGLEVLVGAGDRTVAAVAGADLRLERGEVLGLVGESGAGKTMLGRAVTGMLPPGARTSGELLFDGRDVLRMTPAELHQHRGEGAALCFQNPRSALSPVRHAGAQVADRLAVHARPDAERWTPLSLFRAVDIRDPQRRLDAYPHELSGGMAQRVMISLALACSPQLLVADEPTTGLDVTLTRSILALLRRAAVDHGQAVMIISHDLAAIAEVCDRIAVMYAGTLVEEGQTAEVLRQPAHPYTVALLEAAPDVSGLPTRAVGGSMPALATPPDYCPFAPRCPIARDVCVGSRPPLVEVGAGRRAACFFAPGVADGSEPVVLGLGANAPAAALPIPAALESEPLLRVRDVEVVYRSRFGQGGHRALRGVSLDVRRGETLGVVGESGCGKSTLARVVLGLVRPTAGSVRLGGVEISSLGSRDLRTLRRRVQMVFQDPVDTLDPRRSVEDTLRDSLRLLDLPEHELSVRIDEALARVGLDTALRPRRRHELSGGQAQRVGIARALVLDPELVVFDEPTSALDVTVQAQILELIESLMGARDRSYVFISHDLAIVRSVADRVAVLYLGKVVETGPVEQVFEAPLHPYTRALLSSAPSLRGTRPATLVQLRQELEEGDVAAGCPLAPRCPFALERCVTEQQELTEWRPGQVAACWRVPEIDAEPVAAVGGAA
jgi:oligopeptide/dipeptide ABC transporter ATP-binding protein